MADGNVKLFREKSVDRIQSPESLNDYLRVTSPGIWLVLSAVILLLVGVVLWGILGRITTTVPAAIVSDGTQAVCLVPYDNVNDALEIGTVTVDGEELALQQSVSEPEMITEQTDVLVCLAGEYDVGDIVLEIPVDAQLDSGVYSARLVTESLRPISLLIG